MKTTTVGLVSGVLASAFCLVGGLWILSAVDFADDNDALAIGIGLYFMGKGFFVGPMLVLASRRLT